MPADLVPVSDYIYEHRFYEGSTDVEAKPWVQACDYFADEEAIQACCEALGARLFTQHAADGSTDPSVTKSCAAQSTAYKVCIDSSCMVLCGYSGPAATASCSAASALCPPFTPALVSAEAYNPSGLA